VYPADDRYSALWHELAGARAHLSFAITEDASAADLSCSAPTWTGTGWQVQARTPAGPLSYQLRVAGLHNVKNSLAAAACALAAGVPLSHIVLGLEAFEPVKGRSRALALRLAGRALTLVDDTYNANPDSVRAAIDVLAGLPGPRLLVLGDMGEVGNEGPRFHAEVGAYAHDRGIEQLYTLGEQTAQSAAQFPGARHFADAEALNAAVLQALPQLASVLVKGSRFMRMERVVQAVGAHAEQNKEEHHAA
jgi:UDP-N-acetylmuramoyl-tripeptide--D-alanyl-D-alanine ligase